MTNSWTDLSVEWVLLALRIGFIAVLYLFLLQVARLMLREIRLIGQPTTIVAKAPSERRLADERGLVVVDPGETPLQIGAYIPVAGEVTVGRGGSSDFVLIDPFVSTEHAQIVVSATETVLYDLGSTNGTKVNGDRLSDRTTLFDGDIVQFGNVRLRYAATSSDAIR